METKTLGGNGKAKPCEMQATKIALANNQPRPSTSNSRAWEILSLQPRGLSRVLAAAYINVSPTKFGEMVRDGRMPPPKVIDRRKVWDRRQLDESFEGLPIDGSPDVNPWDEVL